MEDIKILIHPQQVFTPTQAAKFLGCTRRGVKKLIRPAWYDGNKPKFLGQAILDYQQRRINETKAIYEHGKNLRRK